VSFQVPPGEWALYQVPASPAESKESVPPNVAVLLKVDSIPWKLVKNSSPEPEQAVRVTSATSFGTLTGRTVVWAEGIRLIKQSPLLGYGFHADRLLLGTHAHNSLIHALMQTGLIGTLPFMAALLLGWFLLLKSLRNLNRLAAVHKGLLIQSAGVLAFLSVRAVFESTGAFFGVDWLILAPLLLYVKVVDPASARAG